MLCLVSGRLLCIFFFFKQKTAYEMRISDWSSDVCSSDLPPRAHPRIYRPRQGQGRPVPADGLWPPRLQKLRPARDRDAENGARGVRRAEGQRPGVRRSAPARGNGAERRLFRREETVPERRFIFGRRWEEHTSEFKSLLR